VVIGQVKNDHGIINKPIGRSPRDFRRRLAGRGARGEMREAITEYKVIKRFAQGKEKFSYLEIKPKTGRTHQIRVHMKFLNHPVVCDSLYNPSGPCPKGLSRLALHAKSIEFKNLKNETIKIESSLPKEFQKMLK
jgi:23S rRNA pseudouridine1911/1915/1917 synthase